MGIEQRKQERIRGYAKVLFHATMTPGYLRDLSHKGCQVSFVQAVPAAFGEPVGIDVLPVEDLGIPAFSFSLRVRWTRSDRIYYIVGGEIEDVAQLAQESAFGRLLAYYSGYIGGET